MRVSCIPPWLLSVIFLLPVLLGPRLVLIKFRSCPKVFFCPRASITPDLRFFSPSPLQTRTWASRVPMKCSCSWPQGCPFLFLGKQTARESQIAFRHWQTERILPFDVNLALTRSALEKPVLLLPPVITTPALSSTEWAPDKNTRLTLPARSCRL